MRDILDVHTHTLASGHAYNTINEMAQYASEIGLELLGITEHAPTMPGSCHEFYFANLKVLPREMYGIPVLFGVELNILNPAGEVDLQRGYLKQMDIGIASLHTPCFEPLSEQENTDAYINAMKNPYVNIIGHPDDGRYPIDYTALVQAAKEHHVLLEVNNNSLVTSGFRKDTRPNDIKMLQLCKEYRVPVILSSDAHACCMLGKHELAMDVVREVDFPEELIVNRSTEELLSFVNYGNR